MLNEATLGHCWYIYLRQWKQDARNKTVVTSQNLMIMMLQLRLESRVAKGASGILAIGWQGSRVYSVTGL